MNDNKLNDLNKKEMNLIKNSIQSRIDYLSKELKSNFKFDDEKLRVTREQLFEKEKKELVALLMKLKENIKVKNGTNL